MLEIQSGVDVTRTLSSSQMQIYSFKILSKKSLFSLFLSQYSGDTDLILSTESTCFPPIVSSTREGNDLVSLAPAERELLFNRTTGWVYICAVTALDSAYSLRADEEGNRGKVLMFDTMEKALARRNGFVYYQLLVEGNANITVRVVVQTGNPDLYISLCKSNYCTFNENQVHRPEDCKVHLDGILHSSNPDGDEEITFTHDEARCEKQCHYTVGVLGRREVAVFWVIATLEQGHVPLAALAPFVTKAPRGRTTYFKHTITSYRVTKVEFLLVPIVGNPDLYVSTLTPYPNSTSEYHSTNPGNSEELITIEVTLQNSLVGDYFIAVVCSQPASFSLSVLQTRPDAVDRLELTPGLALMYSMENMQQIMLILDISPNPANPRNLRLSVTPTFGKVAVCISHNHTDFSMCILRFECIHTHPFDCIQELPALPSIQPSLSTQYWALVTLETDAEASSVTLLYSSGQHIHLSTSQNYRDIIDANAYFYYVYTVFPPYSGFSVHESIVSGDVDLYLSLGEKDKYPNNATAQYRAETGFEDRLVVSLADMGKYCAADLCVAYISAKAAVRSAFTLNLASARQTIYPLSDGGKMYGHIATGEKYIYELSLNTRDPASILVKPYEGIPIVSGKLLFEVCFEHIETCSGVPLSASDLSYGLQVSISQALIGDLCVSAHCFLWAIVECRDPFCWFQGSGIQSAYQLITPNEPLCDFVPSNSVNYYLLYFAHNFTELTVDLALLSSQSDADLYMNRGTEVTDVGQFQWKSTQIGSDSIHLSAGDIFDSWSFHYGYFLIAVQGKDEARYCLRVTVESTAMVPLGYMPLQVRIKPQSAVLCYFQHQLNEDIAVEGVVKYGAAHLYVKSYPGNRNTTSYPSEEDNHWKSQTFGSNREVLISQDSVHFCYHCLYILAVTNPGHSGAEVLLSHTPAFSTVSVYPYFPVFFSGKYDSMVRTGTPDFEGVCEFYVLPVKGKVTLVASQFSTLSLTHYDYIAQDINGIQYFRAESGLSAPMRLFLGVHLHSDSVFMVGIGRPLDMRYIEEINELVLGVLQTSGAERGFYVGGNCTCQITAVNPAFRFTVADYSVDNGSKTLIRQYQAFNPLINRVTIQRNDDQRTHLILITAGENAHIDPLKVALIRLSVYRYPFAQGLGLNSELFAQFDSPNQGKEYRINAENLSVELEIGLETCGMAAELVIISTLEDGSKREEVVFAYSNITLKSVFWLQNVTFVSVKIEPIESVEGEFWLYSRVINENIELFPGSNGHIQVHSQDSTGEIHWEPPTATGELTPIQLTYQVYSSAHEVPLKSLCTLHSGLLHGNVTYLGSANSTTASVPAGLWVTVLGAELGQRSTTLRTYTLYSPVYVSARETGAFPVAVLVTLVAVVVALLLLCLYCRKRRSAPASSLQASELTSLAA